MHEGKYRIVDIKEAAKYYGLKVSTLYQWVSQKKIPYYKLGRLVKFDLNELDKFIEKTKVNPVKGAYEH
jgi:excisionase family DNA binding protein